MMHLGSLICIAVSVITAIKLPTKTDNMEMHVLHVNATADPESGTPSTAASSSSSVAIFTSGFWSAAAAYKSASASQRVLLPENVCPAFPLQTLAEYQVSFTALFHRFHRAVSTTFASRALKVGRCNFLQRVYINSRGVFIPTYPGNEDCFLNAGSRPAESGFTFEKAATKM